MIQVYPYLWVGDQEDYLSNVKYAPEWYVLQACKEPFHREALGYTGRAAPKDHPEYLFAYRDAGTRLILNMVDADDPRYFPDEMIEEALGFMSEIYRHHHVLVHCNKGESRAPSLALLWLCTNWLVEPNSFEEAEEQFRRLYPPYAPKAGIRRYVQQNWERYRK